MGGRLEPGRKTKKAPSFKTALSYFSKAFFFRGSDLVGSSNNNGSRNQSTVKLGNGGSVIGINPQSANAQAERTHNIPADKAPK